MLSLLSCSSSLPSPELSVGRGGLAGTPLTGSAGTNRCTRFSFSTVISLARPTGGTSSPPILQDGAEDTFSSSFDPTNSFIDVNDGFTDGRKSCTLGESGFLRTPNCVGRDFIFVAWPLLEPLLGSVLDPDCPRVALARL